MGNITENLKKIMTAVYGKDVRQAIHDSISQCEADVQSCKAEMENGINKCKDIMRQGNENFGEILDLLTIPVEGIIYRNGFVWKTQGHGTYTITLEQPTGENRNTQCVSVSVEEGEKYKIDVSGISNDAILATQGDSDQTMFTSLYENLYKKEWISGKGSYLVEIPQRMNLLLVTSDNRANGDIQIKKLRI